MTAPDLLSLRQQGRLSQTCPSCGLVESAGAYCSACATRTGPDDWHADLRNARRPGTAPAGREEEPEVAPEPTTDATSALCLWAAL